MVKLAQPALVSAAVISGQTWRWAARYSSSRSGRTRARKQTRSTAPPEALSSMTRVGCQARGERRAGRGSRPGAHRSGWPGGGPPGGIAARRSARLQSQKLNWLMLALVNTNGGPSRMVLSAPTVNLPSLPAVKDWPDALVIVLEA